MSFIRKVLWYEYGIKVKTIRLPGSFNWYGDKYYLPYYIETVGAGSIVSLFDMSYPKLYRSLEEILEDVKKGNLK